MTSMLSSEERDAMRRGVIQQREEWMKEVAQPYLNNGVEFNIKVVWHHRPYEAIIGEVFSGDHDIVLKATRKHDALESVFLLQLIGIYYANVHALFYSLKIMIGP